MIVHIHGILTAATPSYAIIEAAGVGYKVFITPQTYAKLPSLGSICRLYTVHIIREQLQALYGFLQPTACELFEKLMSTTGVGPKLALSILGHMSEIEFSQAITVEDVSALSKIPGIGKKTAQRLLIEMRDKLPNFIEATQAVDLSELSLGREDDKLPWKLAVNALINLGYTSIVAHKAVKKSLQSQSHLKDNLADLISESLKNI